MVTEVITLHPSPSLADIPGQLRQMATMIESGEVVATSALFIIPNGQRWPDVFGWGEHLGDYGNIALCEMAKTFLMHNNTVRK